MSDVVFLRGVKTTLRPVDKSDAPLFQKWVNDPDVRKFIQHNLPVDLAREERWIDSVSKNDHNNLGLVIEAEGQPIGTMGIHGINWVDGTATSGALIGEKEFWGQGYGTDAKMILLNHAFGNLGLRKVCSAVKAFNKRSKAYLQKTGYQMEGVLRQHTLYDGQYYDLILLAIFKPEFMELWRTYKEKHCL